MSFIDCIDSLGTSSATSSVTLQEGAELPSIGSVMSSCGFDVCVIGVDNESRRVDFHIKKTLDKKEVIEATKSNLSNALDEVAHLLYLWENVDKPSSLILWTDVDDTLKHPYIALASKIVKILTLNDICFIDPDDFRSVDDILV